MNVKEFIYKTFTDAGLKTSLNADANLGERFSTYSTVITPNYLGSSEVKTGLESVDIVFNCYGSSNDKAYRETRAVQELIERFTQISSDIHSTEVYNIQDLPIMDGLYGSTFIATVIYYYRSL